MVSRCRRDSTFRMRRPRLQATLVLSGPIPAGSTPTIRPQPKSSSIRCLRALTTSAGGMKLSNELEIKASLATRGNSCGNRSPSCCCFARRRRQAICASSSPYSVLSSISSAVIVKSSSVFFRYSGSSDHGKKIGSHSDAPVSGKAPEFVKIVVAIRGAFDNSF